jgi:hypothetical protein
VELEQVVGGRDQSPLAAAGGSAAALEAPVVVDQVNGVSAVRKAHLSELHKQARGLVAQFKSFRISWVPRELNAEADRLVNDALGAPA